MATVLDDVQGTEEGGSYAAMESIPNIPIDTLLDSPNIAEDLTLPQREAITAWARAGLEADRQSRERWEQLNAEDLKMALQVTDPKSEPWDGASNIRFPLISIATLHYHARVYPLMVNGNDPVQFTLYGTDADGRRAQRAGRVATHISWQMLEQCEEWESEHDKMIFILGLTGLGIKKTWFDPALRRNRSMCVAPSQLVLNYWASGPIDSHARASYLWKCYPNDTHANIASGLWCSASDYPVDVDPDQDGDDDTDQTLSQELNETPGELPRTTPESDAADRRTGMVAPPLDNATPVEMCEQTCWMDLDGDGYAEPYFVTFEVHTGVLRRIVARFNKSDIQRNKDGDIVNISPERCYDHYELIPSPDGSFYPVGFGRLLGPIDDSCSTAFNQLFDAGTLANYGGGFVGRGARFRGGQLRIKPGMFQQVDSIGNDLKNNIVPYPVPQPSEVLFKLVQYLVQYAERLVSATDLQVGENIGQNTPAQTAQTMDVNGSRIVGGMWKRAWRGFRNEIRTWYSLNRKYIEADVDYRDLTTGSSAIVQPKDYAIGDYDLSPSADPNIISDAAAQQRDMTVFQLSNSQPNFNRYRSTVRLLKSMKVPSIDDIYPPPTQGNDIQAPPSVQMLELQVKQGTLKDKQQQTQAKFLKIKGDGQLKLYELQMQAAKMQAEIMDLQADAVLKLSQAKTENEGKEIALINAAIGARKQQLDGIMAIIGHMIDMHKVLADAMGDGDGTGGTEAGTGDNAGGGDGGNGADGAGIARLAAITGDASAGQGNGEGGGAAEGGMGSGTLQ